MRERKVKFYKSDGQYISQADADVLSASYIKKQKELGQPDPIKSQFYGTDMLSEMLDRKNAVGIRISYGIAEDNKPDVILIPLNKYGDEIFKDTAGLKDDDDSHGGHGPGCPENC